MIRELKELIECDTVEGVQLWKDRETDIAGFRYACCVLDREMDDFTGHGRSIAAAVKSTHSVVFGDKDD